MSDLPKQLEWCGRTWKRLEPSNAYCSPGIRSRLMLNPAPNGRWGVQFDNCDSTEHGASFAMYAMGDTRAKALAKLRLTMQKLGRLAG